jgi:hypothetical protein
MRQPLQELEHEATVEWDTSAPYARGNKHYDITKRGLDMLRESGWRPDARSLNWSDDEVPPVAEAAREGEYIS